MMGELVYVGNSVIPGIPARNLAADEVEWYGAWLIAEMPKGDNKSKKEVKLPSPIQALKNTGLYSEVKENG